MRTDDPHPCVRTTAPHPYLLWMARSIPTLLIVAATLAWASPVAAQGTNAPPGNSGVREYLEVVPGPGGDSPAGDGKHGGDEGRIRGRGAPLPRATGDALRSQGADGAAAAESAERSAPGGVRGNGGRGSLSGSASGSSSGAPSGDIPRARSTSGEGDGRSPLRSFGGAAFGDSSGGGGMGPVLPALLLLTLAGGVAIGVRRWRMSAS